MRTLVHRVALELWDALPEILLVLLVALALGPLMLGCAALDPATNGPTLDKLQTTLDRVDTVATTAATVASAAPGLGTVAGIAAAIAGAAAATLNAYRSRTRSRDLLHLKYEVTPPAKDPES